MWIFQYLNHGFEGHGLFSIAYLLFARLQLCKQNFHEFYRKLGADLKNFDHWFQFTKKNDAGENDNVDSHDVEKSVGNLTKWLFLWNPCNVVWLLAGMFSRKNIQKIFREVDLLLKIFSTEDFERNRSEEFPPLISIYKKRTT